MTNASFQSIQVAGICGSLRRGSFARSALQTALEGAKEAGASTRLIDLTQYELVFCDGKEDESRYPPDVFRLREDVRAAQGIILATPEYHGSHSGVLKNALDLMGFDEFEGKMLALVGVSGGAMGAYGALSSLRDVGRALHAWVVPEQASVAHAWNAFNEDGTVKDEKLKQRLKNVGIQVTRFTRLHRAGSADEFLRMWERAQENPGAE